MIFSSIIKIKKMFPKGLLISQYDNKLTGGFKMPNLSVKTPIWTGDIDKNNNELQITGIMGSLRWWAEAILRGLGYPACDPTGENKCPKQNQENKNPKLCASCMVFGATGLRSMFGLSADKKDDGKIKLNFSALDKDFDESLVLVPLLIASKWGALGSKTQHGYGVFGIEDEIKTDVSRFTHSVDNIIKKRAGMGFGLRCNEGFGGFPNLCEMFFAKVQFETDSNNWKNGMNAPVFSRKVKKLIKNNRNIKRICENNENIQNYLFGTIRKFFLNGEAFSKMSSKIHVSGAYEVGKNLWEFRVWGWIGKNELPENFCREKFLNSLKKALQYINSDYWSKKLGKQTQNYSLKAWREFSSYRDTVKKEENEKEFLKSLLSGEGD